MPEPTIIYLVRHGESENNVAEIISGHVDPDLTELGITQAHDAKKTLSHINFHEVYSSDLQRAAKTAGIVAGKEVPSHHRLKTLREKSYGSLEGQSNHKLEPDKAARLTLPKQQSLDYKHVADMESDREVAERLLAEIENIAQRHPGQTVLIGSHGTAIRVVLMTIQDKHYNEMPAGSINNGGYVKLIYSDGKFVIDEVRGYN